MRNDTDSPRKGDMQQARFRLRFGRRAGLSGSVNVTDRGLLAIAVLVSSILVSTALLVGVSVREGKRLPSS